MGLAIKNKITLSVDKEGIISLMLDDVNSAFIDTYLDKNLFVSKGAAMKNFVYTGDLELGELVEQFSAFADLEVITV